ncbi:hypothetical protein KIN20_016980 [Parelaphostrongylus tenuis]|uniref:Uncharacterized protein n=1 Tax=Parelaphostrongylus tenuis TaxID=148309 RepID=A0AAD5MZC4_PARTN|nr:hypothetical protein KIN20_016980 [Parelaphostrongylus tenuis]
MASWETNTAILALLSYWSQDGKSLSDQQNPELLKPFPTLTLTKLLASPRSISAISGQLERSNNHVER